MEKFIRPEFQTHKLNQEGIMNAGLIAEAFSTLLHRLEQMVPEGEELQYVRTKLQEASFFAKKGMAKDPRFNEGQLR